MTRTVIRNDVADLVYEQIGLSRKDSVDMVDAVIDEIKEGIVNEGLVKLPGFGTFSVSHKKARAGRNPKTGDVHEVSERNVVKFRPSVMLRKRLNNL